MNKHVKKALGIVSAAAMTLTSFAGASASSLTNANVLMTDRTVENGGAYIQTFYKPEYFAKSAFKVEYQYLQLDTDGKVTVDGKEQDVDYTDALDFKVFNMEWGGWEATSVGVAKPELGKSYEATVSIADIEKKLGSGTVQGINFETGAIGDAEVKVVSLEYVNDAEMTGASATFEGSWVKGSGGTLTKSDDTTANITADEWKIQVSNLCAYGFKCPTVDVTVEYTTNPNNYVQAEILAGTGNTAQPIVPYFPKVTKTGTVTYTTEFNANLTAMTICYDSCTVKKIHIYDNTAGDVDVSVTGKTADQIAANMGAAWNLGNALDSTDESGKADEVAWGNPVTTKKLIQAVKAQGFNTVRIPVSYVDKITSGDKVDPDYLARIKQVVDYAYSMGMYVVINMHNDGGHGVATKWLDITKTGDEFKAIEAKFGDVWKDIANYFKDYDQKLAFEGYNELMNGDYNSTPTKDQLENVNALAQKFVTEVRNAGGKNDDRVLIVAGYNTNIQQTIRGFVKPTDATGVENRLMLSVHYYDPYDFVLDEKSSVNTWGTDAQKAAMESAIEAIAEFAFDKEMPVFIGEYGPIDKNNTDARKDYCYWLNYYAKNNTCEVPFVLAYWDNGVVGTNGSALFDRVNNTVTPTGAEIISEIRRGAGL